jgi:WD40 repeat protein
MEDHHKSLGDAACRAGDFEEALACYLRCDQSGGGDWPALAALHSNRSLALLKLGRAEEALAAADAAVAARPRWPKGLARRAAALAAARPDEPALALAAYARAAELDPALGPPLAAAVAALERRLARRRCHAVLAAPGAAAAPPVLATAAAPGGAAVATACADGAVRLWDVESRMLLQELRGHAGAVTCLAWAPPPAAPLLASGALDGTARCWTPAAAGATTFVARAVLGGHEGRVSALAFVADGARLLLATADAASHSVRLWGLGAAAAAGGEALLADPPCLHSLAHGGLVAALAASPPDAGGALLASASADGGVRVWAAAEGTGVADFKWGPGPATLAGFLPPPPPLGAHGGGDSAAPPAAPLLLTAHADLERGEARALLWDVLDRRTGWVDGRLAAPAAALEGLAGRPADWAAAWARPEPGAAGPALLLALVCAGGGGGRVWDVTPGNNGSTSGAASPVPLFSFDLEDAGAASFPNFPDAHAQAWRGRAAAALARATSRVAFSPSAARLAAVGDAGTILAFDVADGARLAALPRAHGGRGVRALLWLSDAELLSAGEDGAARVWRFDGES